MHLCVDSWLWVLVFLCHCFSSCFSTFLVDQSGFRPMHIYVKNPGCMLCIRASVDALCRDDTDQISRDPHT